MGLSGNKGLGKAIQLKQKLLEFDQTRYAWYALLCTALTLTGALEHMPWQLLVHSLDKQVGAL